MVLYHTNKCNETLRCSYILRFIRVGFIAIFTNIIQERLRGIAVKYRPEVIVVPVQRGVQPNDKISQIVAFRTRKYRPFEIGL